jgi:glucose dehydrogenase
MKTIDRTLAVALFVAAMGAMSCAGQASAGWPVYDGGPDGEHYSRLTQINRANVSQLKLAWSFDTGEKGGLQANPVIVGRTLYAYTPKQKVIALDAVTGKLKWKFEAGIEGTQPNRGVAYWTDGKQGRILAGVMNFLYCLDAETGKPIAAFGEDGRIDLRKGLDRGLGGNYEEQSIALTTPGIVYKDLIIVGGRNPETHPAPPGDVRAFDVRTGKLRWSFHTIPRPGELGYETWPPEAWKTAGAANNWGGMALDAARGIVYVPTGSAVFDFYGGDRVGDDLYANTLLALDAATGKRLWHFQGVHHDIWDRDFPAPPALFTLERNGKQIPALAQTTKQGYVYLFNRLTGKPLVPIREVPYPASDVPGEVAAKTQPKPDWPASFARQELTADMLTQRTPEAHAWAMKAFGESQAGGQFLPFKVGKQTLILPGFDGGAEWGGPAVDPVSEVLYVNANEMAWVAGLVPAEHGGSLGVRLYRSQCAVCHGRDRSGAPPSFPSLIGIDKRLTVDKIKEAVSQGTGRMPSFPNIDEPKMVALLGYLRSEVEPAAGAGKEMMPVPGQGAPKMGALDESGADSYRSRCAVCHGDHMEGMPSMPMLIELGSRATAAQVTETIQKGKGAMPAAPEVAGPELEALLKYLGVDDSARPAAADEAPEYEFTGYKKFLDPDGYPAIAPPWGTLSAIDLKTGKFLWKKPFGEFPELAAKGMKNTGTENYGGPVVTAGGLLFIGATIFDHRFRAFDTRNGEVLWETVLPYSGVATPSTYMIDGKQFVVIAASSMRDPKSPQGGAYFAFALPR